MFGRESILASNGPLSTDREGLELFMEVILAAQPWRTEPSLRVAPWVKHRFSKPLKIAVQWWDGVVKPHLPMIRALREVSEACKAAGMQVVDWNSESMDHHKGWEILSGLFYPDGGRQVLGLLESAGEPILPLTNFIIKEQPNVKDLTIHEMWKVKLASLPLDDHVLTQNVVQLCVEREAYRTRYARHWTSTADQDGREVDVILCPPAFGAATPHQQSRYWGYGAIWNLLDYPAVVFPVTTVDPFKDQKDETYVPKNADDQFVYDLYDPEVYKDAPVSLQIVGRRHLDEKVLAALAEIERALGRGAK